MSCSRIPSPARSQGVPPIMASSPRPRKSRRTRSVCSATSNTSLRLTTVIQDAFQMSLMPDRMSVLNDDTDIQIPGCQSWWKRLGNNSRDVTEIMQEAKENEAIVKVTNVAEEFDVEILSQEKENMSVDLPDSSDGESIHSIVIPKCKLFTNQGNRLQTKLKETIIRKETLDKMQKNYCDQTNIDKEINVIPRKLFNQASKLKTNPVFTGVLLNASANKTVNVNKSIEKQTQEVHGQVRNLFGNQPGTKRKNVYAEFLLSDSEDEIPQILPRVFEFQKKTDHQQRSKQQRRSHSQSSVHSSASNMTDIEIGEWQHLPSSTMVEHQFEVGETPLKRTRLSRLSKPKKSDIASNKNNSINKSKRSDSKIMHPESEEMNIINTRSQSLNKSKNSSNLMRNKNESLTKAAKKNISKLAPDVSMDKTLTEEILQESLDNKEPEITLTEENQHTDEADDENFSLEYENDYEQIFDMNGKNCESNQNISNKEKNYNVDLTKTEKKSQKSNNSPNALDITEKQRLNIEIDSNQKDSNLNKKSTQNVSQAKSNDMHDEVLSEMNREINKDDAHEGREILKTSKHIEKNGNESKQALSEKQGIELQEAKVLEERRSDYEFENDADDKMEHKQIELEKRDNQQTDRHKTIETEQKNQYISIHNENNQENTDSKEQSQNLTHETYGKSKNKEILKSPEAVLHSKSNKGESFNTNGHNTSFNKSKTLIKDLNIRPSLATARESTGLTDGTVNSSAEGSVWDSHRTTRKTLRMTFGRDFTPRKSLRTLVMERAAKQQANYNQNDQVADKSKRKSNFHEATDKAKDNSKMQTSIKKVTDKSSVNVVTDKSKHQNEVANKSNQSKRQTYFGDITNKRPIANSTELPDFESYLEQDEELNREPEQNEEVESDQEPEQDKEVKLDQVAEQNIELESDQEAKQNSELESDNEPEQDDVESDQETEQNTELESDNEPKQDENVESDQETEQNTELESDNEPEQDEDAESDQDADQNPEVESNQEPDQNEVGFENGAEQSESNQELKQNEELELDQEQDQSEVSVEESAQESDENEEVELDQEAEQNSEVGSDQEPEQNEEVESDQGAEEEEEEMLSDQEPDLNEESESDKEPELMEEDETDHEASMQLRLSTREMYFQKLKQENAERRRKVKEKVMNMLKMPPVPFSVFKMPEVPKKKRSNKIIMKKATKTKLKPSLFSKELPPEFFDDLKYKPPKRFQGKNAPWITKRLYKFLEDKLQPKYDYHARVRAEKLVEKLYVFAKDVRKCERAAPPQAISELKHEMARLGVVTTHHQFYLFFHEFMPREIRIRVNPDIMNKIPKPKSVFSNILKE